MSVIASELEEVALSDLTEDSAGPGRCILTSCEPVKSNVCLVEAMVMTSQTNQRRSPVACALKSVVQSG
jgi:hypothetical protein